MSTFLLEIVTPERKVYAQDVDMVSVKGIEGEFGILPNHIPFVTHCKLRLWSSKKDRQEEYIAVNGGFVEVRKDKVVILAESAERQNDIDLDRAMAAKNRAEQRLKAKQDEFDFRRSELSMQRAMNRINVKKHR